MAEPTSCCVEPSGYRARVHTLFNIPNMHVPEVAWRERSGRIPAGPRAGRRPGSARRSHIFGVDVHIWHDQPSREGTPRSSPASWI